MRERLVLVCVCLSVSNQGGGYIFGDGQCGVDLNCFFFFFCGSRLYRLLNAVTFNYLAPSPNAGD